MKLLQNLARVFVNQLEARLEHEITEALAPPKPRKPRAPRVPKGPSRLEVRQARLEQMRQAQRIVKVSPGVEYIPPEKPKPGSKQ